MKVEKIKDYKISIEDEFENSMRSGYINGYRTITFNVNLKGSKDKEDTKFEINLTKSELITLSKLMNKAVFMLKEES